MSETKKVPFRNTIRLIELTKNCTPEEQAEIIGYISELESMILRLDTGLDGLVKNQADLKKLIGRQ